MEPEHPSETQWKRPRHYWDARVPNPLVERNTFIDRMPDRSFPKTFPESKALLPEPFWDGHPGEIACYWKAWDLAFRNTKRTMFYTGFITPFIDVAFNDCLFLWDSVFILMFARYGERAFPFQRTLDNFYTKQHPDGFISRQIREWSGEDAFHYADPDSTGPNLFAWSEWEYFLQFGDRERLREVFPVILAYHRWMRRHRTWLDGTYWSTGWGCGMDNQPRLMADLDPEQDGWNDAHHHDHLVWLDTTAQAVFSAKLLGLIAAELGCEDETADERAEAAHLTRVINDTMWNEELGFYVDRRRDGALSDVKSIGAYWTLLAGVAPRDRAVRMTDHLTDPRTFGRPHAIPTLSADHPKYAGHEGGLYWRGGVWCPTNYMVLRALSGLGSDGLAHELARSHLQFVTATFESTGTLWENYSPEKVGPGDPAKPDFVGWSGLGPIAIFLEYVLGLRPDFPAGRLVWDVRLKEAHGVRNYPFGPDTTLDLAVEARASESEKPVFVVKANRPVEVEMRWDGGSQIVKCEP